MAQMASNIDFIAAIAGFRGHFSWNFTIGKYEGPEIQIAMFSLFC